MKIANLILTSQNGGAERVFLDYGRILQQIGHEVVAVVKKDAPYADEVLKLGINVKKITNRFGYYDVASIKKLQKIFEDEEVEVVFAHAGRAMALAKKAIKNIKNRKVLLVGVNHSMNVKRSIGCDIILSVNKQIFFKTIDAGQSEERSFIVNNAISLDDAIKEIPENNLTQKSTIKLGVIGRLDAAKGFHHAVNALKILEKSERKFTLNIAGDGVERENLQKQVKNLNLEDSVNFLGWTDDKKEFYQGIDVFLLPSENETFGLVLIEAMKYRKPIISSNADGPLEIIRDGIDGLIFNVKGSNKQKVAEELVQKILRIVEEKGLADELIENSFNRLCEKFSYVSLENRLSDIVGRI
jgi:glycosyltransferase involved in cell wall biosynthesis